MENLPDKLEKYDLKELKKQGRVIFFNYVGPLPNLDKKDILTFIKGDSNAFVDGDLYTKEGSCTYGIHKKDWIKTEEAIKYAPFLLEMNGVMLFVMDPNHYFLTHKNKHLN